jgi:hypothetical protein
MHPKGAGMADEAIVEVPEASGSRSPNGQHVFSTHVGGVPLFTWEGAWNPALGVEVVREGSMLRHANGAWQAAGWQVRVRGVSADAAITNGRVR